MFVKFVKYLGMIIGNYKVWIMIFVLCLLLIILDKIEYKINLLVFLVFFYYKLSF